jgi:hypothetical protein
MKHFIIYLFIAGSISVNAQEKIVYKDLLLAATEIEFTDSLHFAECPEVFIPLDSSTVKNIFNPLYHAAGKSWGNSLKWSLAGKITSYANYDLLLLIEKNEGNGGLYFHTLHLITMSKVGRYIASFGLHINRNTKHSSYNTSSSLYKDLSIIQNTKVFASQKKFGGTNEYKINEAGMFVYFVRN